MQAEQLTSKIRPVFKYVYLTAFFVLLAGFFHPMIYRYSFDLIIVGIFTLFIGLAGGVMLAKAVAPEAKYPEVLMGMGLFLICTSLFLIYKITGAL